MTAWLAVAIVGCGGSKLSGKYASDGNALTVEFKSGQAVLADVLGSSETVDYTVNGSSVTLKSKQRGDLQFTINSDGSLTGNGVTLKKTGD